MTNLHATCIIFFVLLIIYPNVIYIAITICECHQLQLFYNVHA